MIYLHIFQKDGKLNGLLSPDKKIKMDKTVKPMGTVELDDSSEAGKANVKALRTALQSKKHNPQSWLAPEKVQEYLKDVQKKDETIPSEKETHTDYVSIFQSINPNTQVKIEDIFDSAMEALDKLPPSNNLPYMNAVEYLKKKLSSKPLLRSTMREESEENIPEKDLEEMLVDIIYQKVLTPIEKLSNEDRNVIKFHKALESQLKNALENFKEEPESTDEPMEEPAVPMNQRPNPKKPAETPHEAQPAPEAPKEPPAPIELSKKMTINASKHYPSAKKEILKGLKGANFNDEQMKHAMNLLSAFEKEIGI